MTDIKIYLENLGLKKFVINHKDGNKSNNIITNLEIITSSENTIHAIKTGLIKIGEDSSSSYSWITNEIVRNICDLLENGEPTKNISEILHLKSYGLNDSQITQLITVIYNGRNWSHISKNYSFSKRRIPRSKSYSFEQVKYICELLESGNFSIKEIALRFAIKYNLPDTNKDLNKYKCFISRIYKRKSHTEISKKYNF